jgi:hypothetical protein
MGKPTAYPAQTNAVDVYLAVSCLGAASSECAVVRFHGNRRQGPRAGSHGVAVSSFQGAADVMAFVRDPSFFDALGAHLDAMLPTIESSLVLQGGSATLADAIFCFERQYQSLCIEGEDTVISKLEKRWTHLKSRCSSSQCDSIRRTRMWPERSSTPAASTS